MTHPSIELHGGGLSVREIGKQLKLTPGRIYQIFREHDYKPKSIRPYKGEKVLWSESEIQFIKDHPEMTNQQIADALDRGLSSVKSKRQKLSEHREYSCVVCDKRISQKGRYCTDCNWIERSIAQSVYRSRQKDREYSLPEEHAISLLLDGCVYCGDKGGGLDRVDSSKGYTIENTVSCCTTCNTMKMDMPLNDWLSHMTKILEKQNGA